MIGLQQQRQRCREMCVWISRLYRYLTPSDFEISTDNGDCSEEWSSEIGVTFDYGSRLGGFTVHALCEQPPGIVLRDNDQRFCRSRGALIKLPSTLFAHERPRAARLSGYRNRDRVAF